MRKFLLFLLILPQLAISQTFTPFDLHPGGDASAVEFAEANGKLIFGAATIGGFKTGL